MASLDQKKSKCSADLSGDDLLVDFVWVVVKERGMANKHLVDQDSKSPPIDSLSVPVKGKGNVSE